VQPRDNALAAYDAATGKLLWRVSGHAGLPRNREEYFGLFFLGAPLDFDGQLLVLGDRSGEACFLTIDAKTGAKLSEVSLCVATRPANTVFHRQQDACPITVADGIAFCPTQYGRLFAVDLISRRILWNFEYPHTLTSPNQYEHMHYVNPAVSARPEVSAPIVAGHLVVFLPSDGDKLYALNRASGKMVWQSPVEKSNLLVAVHEGKALATGETTAAFDLETGNQLWKTQPGVPIGRGVALGDKYLVPVPGKRLVEVSLKDGSSRDCARVPVAGSPAAVQSAGIALPEDWKFTLLKFQDDEWTQFEFDDEAWRTARVHSGGWETLGFRNYRGTAYYRLKFKCPAIPDGRRLVLQCDGIRGQAVFAVNGQQVGAHQAGPGQALLLDITEPAKPEAENVLAVCVQTLTESGGLTVQPSLCFRQASAELRELGNLIVCRDTLVSSSGDGVEVFPMAATALRALEESFRREGETAKNLLRRAKVSLCQGKPDEAIKDLRKARELEADDLLKESLRAALVQALMDMDKASKDKERTYLFEAKALAANREERCLVLERLMGHYQDSGQMPEAVKTAMEMAELVGDGMVDVDDGTELRTRADRWLAGRIPDIWRSAGKDHAERLAAEFKAETDKLSLDDEKAVRSFLKVYGELPDSATLWLKLAEKLAQGDRWHEAENIYLRFTKDEKPEVAASALWGMAQLSHLLGIDEDADYFVRVLQARHGNVALPDGQTVAAATEQLRKELRLVGQGAPSPALRPVKKVEITVSNAAPNVYHYPLMTDGAWLPYYRTTQFANDRGVAIKVLSSHGDWDIPLPPQQYVQPWQMFGMQRIMAFSGYHAQSVFAVGHQAYFAMNMQLFAALPVKRRVLWRRCMESDWRAGAGPIMGAGQWSNAYYQPGGIIRVQRGQFNMYQQRYCMLMGATPRCLLFYDSNEFVALDPVANEPTWRRALNCPDGTEILLSESHLYEIPPDGKLRAYRLSDGRKVGEKDIGNLRSRPGLYYQGRYISAAASGANAELTSVDPFTGRTAWSASLPAQANYFRLNDGELGVLQANGTLSLISLDSGLKTFEAKAPELGGVPTSMVYGWSTPSLMFVIVPSGRTQGANLQQLSNARHLQFRGNQFQVGGDIHCFDARAGKFLWKRTMANDMMMFSSAGSECPVIPLIKQINKQVKEGQQARWIQGFELEVVEAATGRLLGQHKAEEGGHVYQMMEEKDALILRTNTGTVAIRYQVDTSGAPAKDGAPLTAPAGETKEK
jgi:outer membrane protein assembly factor BamB/tetratricopeptide (TPR) repeat protein